MTASKRLMIGSNLLVFGVAGAARATTVNLAPQADAFVSAKFPDNNYGGAGALEVAATSASKGGFGSLLRFDVSSVKSSFDTTYGPGNWSVQSVVLTLTPTAPNNSIFAGNGAGPGGTNVNTAGLFEINYFADDSWIEGNGTPAATGSIAGELTFNNQPSAAADQSLGSFSFSGGTTGANAYTLGSSAGEMANLTGGTASNPLSLRIVPADASVAYLFNSHEFGTAASRPSLAISATAVPEPAGLLALVVLSETALARRKARS